MPTLAKILRTIGRWLTWPPAWEYAAPRQFGPWHYYRYPCYRYPSRFEDAPTDLAMKAQGYWRPDRRPRSRLPRSWPNTSAPNTAPGSPGSSQVG
jgi:hypothetical protein